MPSLCQPSGGRNLTIGVLGNSITYGAEVEPADAWPAQLQRRLGSATVLNGAVRASSADFAALCWEEIWAHATTPRSPASIDLVVIDYSYTSSALQIEALVMRMAQLRIPTLAHLYCPHSYWQRELRKLVDEPGAARAHTSSVTNASVFTRKVLTKIDRMARSLLDNTRLVDERHMPHARARLGVGGRLGAAERAARAAAALLVLPSTRNNKKVHGQTWTAEDVRLAWQLIEYRNRSHEAEELREALDVLAAGRCLDGFNRTRDVFHRWGVPYISNARQLRRRAERVLTRGGAFAAHPNAEGHTIIANAVEQLFWERCSSVGDSPRPMPPDTKLRGFDEQICTTGARMPSRNCGGFTFVDPGHGRQAGLVSNASGATCELQLTTRKLRSGFMSLAFERGWRNRGRARLDCVPPCWCSPAEFEVGTGKRYTFTQRTAPRWTVLGPDRTCSVRVTLASRIAGRVMIQGITLAPPLPNNRSVDTASLYALLVND
jgi:hypothetical protein